MTFRPASLVKAVIGDIFASRSQTLVNTVNCVGVMGKGVALEFKRRFPRMAADYTARCVRREVRPGEPYLYADDTSTQIVNFPTKDHWRSSSRLGDIERGLDHLASRGAVADAIRNLVLLNWIGAEISEDMIEGG